MDKKYLREKFAQVFGEGPAPRFFCAPARVNLIGEHIDYNGGDVFPAALDLVTVVAARPREDGLVRLAADDLPGIFVACPLSKLHFFKGTAWGSYQLGVASELQKAGYPLCGCDLYFWSDIPFGSGLSSSASIQVATAVALVTLGAESAHTAPNLDLTSLAVLCQRSENQFVGVNCGIMDQFASAHGKRGHAILLNCKTLDYELVPLAMEGYALVIGNTCKKRGLGDSKYNERRAECDEAMRLLKDAYPERTLLCELSLREFEAAAHLIKDAVLYRRALHVVSENERVRASVAALRAGDLKAFGALMNQSHDSLRDLYEVTGFELDSMVDEARKIDGVLGARMTGAGFGGCTVSLVPCGKAELFMEQVGERYYEKTGILPAFYVTLPDDGARELTD